MVSQKIVIKNFSGLHLRPAGVLCGLAGKYESDITFDFEDSHDVNAKSILSVLTACVKKGDEILLKCSGSDEVEALEALVEIIDGGLGEWDSKDMKERKL